MSVSREASLTLSFVLIVNLIIFLAFEAQSLLLFLTQVGSVMLWFAMSKVRALNPIYAQIARVWYKLRTYIRVLIICLVVFLMVKNKVCRMVVSGFYSFRGITYFCQHRIRIKISGSLANDADLKLAHEPPPMHVEIVPSTPFMTVPVESSVTSVNKRLFIEDMTSAKQSSSVIPTFGNALKEHSSNTPSLTSSLVLYNENRSHTSQGNLTQRHSFQPKYSSTKSSGVHRPIPPTESISSPFHHPRPLQSSSSSSIHSYMDRGQLQYASQQGDSEAHVMSVRPFLCVFRMLSKFVSSFSPAHWRSAWLTALSRGNFPMNAPRRGSDCTLHSTKLRWNDRMVLIVI
jgi:hypothetical protein